MKPSSIGEYQFNTIGVGENLIIVFFPYDRNIKILSTIEKRPGDSSKIYHLDKYQIVSKSIHSFR